MAALPLARNTPINAFRRACVAPMSPLFSLNLSFLPFLPAPELELIGPAARESIHNEVRSESLESGEQAASNGKPIVWGSSLRDILRSLSASPEGSR